MLMKTCVDCGVEFPATTDYFHQHKRSKDGLRSNCKECRKSERADYYNNHKEEAKLNNKIYKIING